MLIGFSIIDFLLIFLVFKQGSLIECFLVIIFKFFVLFGSLSSKRLISWAITHVIREFKNANLRTNTAKMAKCHTNWPIDIWGSGNAIIHTIGRFLGLIQGWLTLLCNENYFMKMDLDYPRLRFQIEAVQSWHAPILSKISKYQ